MLCDKAQPMQVRGEGEDDEPEGDVFVNTHVYMHHDVINSDRWKQLKEG